MSEKVFDLGTNIILDNLRVKHALHELMSNIIDETISKYINGYEILPVIGAKRREEVRE